MSADQPATPNTLGVPGKALAAQREAMGWSVEQVAEQLKLQVRQVVALEAGDYAALPGPAVVRGFVRAYAKIVRLDAAPLVAMIELENPAVPDTSASVRREKPATFSESSRFPLHGKRSSLPLGWIAVAIVVLAAAGAAWHFGVVPMPGGASAPSGNTVLPSPVQGGAAAPTAPAPAGTTTEPLQNPSVPLISVPGQNAAPQNPQPGNGAAPAGQAPAPAPAGGPSAATEAMPAPAQAAPAQPPVLAATATAVGPNALVLDVREDSWIQARTNDGKNLISRLVKAGSTETVTLDQPVTLTVGNPKGVNATLRGADVALPMIPGKTIARVSLK
jgi:cytoskeleton protein RodZ